MSSVIYFQPPAIYYFYSALVLHTLHPYSHYCVFMQGISDSAAMREAKKKREKSLQRRTQIGQTRFNLIIGAVSADGDDKRSSGVDDLARNERLSQVLALTSRCHMWLHVAYGV